MTEEQTTIKNDLAEFTMKEAGIEKLRAARRDALANRREAALPGYKAVVSLALAHSHEEIDEALKGSGRGRPSVAIQALRDTNLDGKTLGALALQSLINGVTINRSLQSVTERLGGAIEDEVRLRWLAKSVPGLYKYLQREEDRKGTVDYAHRRSVFLSAIPRLDVAEVWQKWDLKTKAHVGLWLTDLYVRLGVFETHREGSRRRLTVRLRLSDAALREVASLEERIEGLVRPEYRPMLTEPAPWTTPTDGGYKRLDLSIMKTRRRQDLERLARADMPAVYASLNAVQRTPWKVNEDVLVVAEELKSLNAPVKGLPELRELSRPTRPDDLPPIGEDLNDAQKEELSKFKAARRAWFDAEAKRSSRTTQSLQILTIARDCSGEDRIWFPYQLDYRGRMYAVPQALQPQGNDLAKGLLTFADGKPLGVWGGYWLAVHGANTWGVDKGALAARVDWTIENSDRICAVAEDPFADLWWTDADGGAHPWQFLAFCFEWAGYIASGESEDFVSYLPIAVDGSCNGLQHYSAMLRDPVGAFATNLTNSKEQQDIYAAVAERTLALVKLRSKQSATDREMAGRWTEYGIKRSTVKRCVMTTPYGATVIGMRDMILQDTIQQDRTGFHFGDKPWETAGWLASVVYEAIGETVAAAQEAMDFLRSMAKATNKPKQGIGWLTPAGLPVVQRIPNLKRTRVETRLLGHVDLVYSSQGPLVDTRKQVTSIAPNFVHSLDAAHLMLTVAAMEGQYGQTSWAMVHDSYGTHAGEIQALGEVLREQFVLMYQDHEPLEELRQSVARATQDEDLAPTPPVGVFNLFEVLEAEFFFA